MRDRVVAGSREFSGRDAGVTAGFRVDSPEVNRLRSPYPAGTAGGQLFDAFPAMPVQWGASVIAALGSALFVPALISGVLFLAGIAVSNWRHALIAALGALIANALAAQAGALGGAINFGFAGFNGVLAALAVYIIISADLRLAILGSILATWLASYVYRGAPVPVLASGFVLATWLILLLGWLNPRFAANQPEPKQPA